MKTELNYLFDVDGTLTPSRGVIDDDFKKWLINFSLKHNIVLVTGSDRPKTIEQIGTTLYNKCRRVYNCSGNDVYEKENQIKFNDWKLPAEAEKFLTEKLTNSKFTTRTGLHIEHRIGMINFSVVGRNANTEQRKVYHEWDKIVNERIDIAKQFNETFPDLSAKVGGETGIDIFAKGCDKSQVVHDYDISSIRFFGDRCDEAGNDYPVANLLEPHQVFHIKDWKHCWELLKNV